MTFSSGSRITRNSKKQRLNLSRDGGEFDTQKEGKDRYIGKDRLSRYGVKLARKVKQNQFNLFAEA